MKAITLYTYKLSELLPKAREKAIENQREFEHLVFDSKEAIEDCAEALKAIGIDVYQKRDRKPAVYYEGFGNRGDGAWFEADYSYKAGALAAIKKERPTDLALHNIAKALQGIESRYFYKLTAKVEPGSNLYHQNLSVTCDGVANVMAQDEAALKSVFKDVAAWIYKCVESEYDYRTSDAACVESIEVNDYDFYESGLMV